MEKLIYTTSTLDPLRLDQLKVFLWSLHKNGNDWPVALDLVNCTEEEGYKAFMDVQFLNPCLTLANISQYDKSVGCAKDCTEISMTQLDAMYSRPIGVGKYLTEDGPDMICSIDTDIIVRDNLERIWKGEWDLNLYFREKKRDKLKFQGGLIVYRNIPKVREYYREFLGGIEEQQDSVYPCQLQMYLLAIKHKLEIGKLPEKYNDSILQPNSKVWHIKHSHTGKKKWQNEFKQYLKEANERIAS